MTILTLNYTLHIFGIYHTRGGEFRTYWPSVFESEKDNGSDEWIREILLVYGLKIQARK